MAATVCPLCHTDLLLYTSSRRSIPVVPVGGNSEMNVGWTIVPHPWLHLICGLQLYLPPPSYNIHSEFLTSLVITLIGLDGPPNCMTQIFIPRSLEPW